MKSATLPLPSRSGLRQGRGAAFLVLLFPGLLLFSLFTLYPLAKLLAMSFCEWRIGRGQVSRFVGLLNYLRVFQDPVAGTAVANTALYTLLTVPAQIAIGLVVAVMIGGVRRGRVLFRVLYYLPVVTSWVIVSLVFRYLFANEGFVNYLVADVMRLTADGVPWLDGRFTAVGALSLLGVWKGVGWNVVVFMAALQAVPVELYEGAAMDGCGRAASFFRITIPSIRGTLLFALVMLTIGAFNVFTPIKLITDGRPAHQTEVVLSWMYDRAFRAGQLGYSAALSYCVALVIGVITVLLFGYFRRFRD